MSSTRKKIIRLLGVGFDTDDEHVRITNADHYDVLMGSEESHAYLHKLIAAIEAEIDQRGLRLDELTQDELTAIIASVQGV